MSGKNLETKYSKKAGSQGSGKAIPVQLGKMGSSHGRDYKAVNPGHYHKKVKR